VNRERVISLICLFRLDTKEQKKNTFLSRPSVGLAVTNKIVDYLHALSITKAKKSSTLSPYLRSQPKVGRSNINVITEMTEAPPTC